MKTIPVKDYWQKYWTDSSHQPLVRHEEMLRVIMEIFQGKLSAKKILEVGGGMGGDSLFLAQKEAQITVLDFSQKALEQIKESARQIRVTLDFVEADAKKLPFNDQFFDLVFHQGFLEHYKDPEIYLQEQKRVLKTGGFLVVDVPQKYTTYTIKKHLKIKKGEWFTGWETEYSPNDLKNLVARAGFKVIKMYGWGYYGKIAKLGWLIDRMPFKLYLNWCIGIVARKT